MHENNNMYDLCQDIHHLKKMLGDVVTLEVARGFFAFRGALTFIDEGLAGLAAVTVIPAGSNTFNSFNVSSVVVNLAALTNVIP